MTAQTNSICEAELSACVCILKASKEIIMKNEEIIMKNCPVPPEKKDFSRLVSSISEEIDLIFHSCVSCFLIDEQ